MMIKVSVLKGLQLLYSRELVYTDIQDRTCYVEAGP